MECNNSWTDGQTSVPFTCPQHKYQIVTTYVVKGHDHKVNIIAVCLRDVTAYNSKDNSRREHNSLTRLASTKSDPVFEYGFPD